MIKTKSTELTPLEMREFATASENVSSWSMISKSKMHFATQGETVSSIYFFTLVFSLTWAQIS